MEEAWFWMVKVGFWGREGALASALISTFLFFICYLNCFWIGIVQLYYSYIFNNYLCKNKPCLLIKKIKFKKIKKIKK